MKALAAHLVGQSAVIDPEEPFDDRCNGARISEVPRPLNLTIIEGPLSPAADIHAAASSEMNRVRKTSISPQDHDRPTWLRIGTLSTSSVLQSVRRGSNIPYARCSMAVNELQTAGIDRTREQRQD